MRRGPPLLGQHFLTAPAVAREIVKEARLRAGEVVLEIGAGKGILTEEILRNGLQIIAVEKDHSLIEELRERFKKDIGRGLKLIEGDIRDFDPGRAGLQARQYSLVSNIPYYLTGFILRKFLTHKVQPKAMYLMLQREVAERIMARSGRESILSISVKAYGKTRLIRKVPRNFFSPQPKVDGAIIAIEEISREFFKRVPEDFFFGLLRRGFGRKRKQLRGNLAAIAGKEKLQLAWKSCRLLTTARAEELSTETWRCLAKHLQ